MLDLPARLSLARLPTPFQLLTRASEQLGVRIWIKRDDLTGITLTGNKIRKLEYTLAQALQQGCDAIVTCGGLQSNHCRATAFAGAELGLHVSLVLRGVAEGEPDGNLLLDYLAGAEVETHSPSNYTGQLQQLLETRAEQLRERGLKPFIIPTGASDGHGVWGYVAAAQELQEDFRGAQVDPQYVVCATGSAGTQAGLTLGFHLLDHPVKVLGMAVCDDSQYFHDKVHSDISQWSEWYGQRVALDRLRIYVNDSYIGPGYARAETAVFETIAWLARREGILLDPVYTGKAFHGMIQEIRHGCLRDCEDIVFVHTGGIFGDFPFKASLAAEADTSSFPTAKTSSTGS